MMLITCKDSFSKIVQLVPLQDSNACTVVYKFLSMVVSQHGLLECIISDFAQRFHGHFWDELMFLLDIHL